MLATVLLWLTGFAMADDLATSLPLAEAVHRALTEHPRVGEARHRLAAAQARLSGAGTQPNPTLELTGYVGAISEDANSVSQRLEIAGQPGLRYDSAKEEVSAATSDLTALQNDLAREVVSAWLDLWEARQNVAASHELLDLEEKVLHAAEERNRLGLMALREVLPVQVERDMSRQELIAAELSEREKLAALNLLIARNPEDPVGELPLPESVVLDDRSLEDRLSQAAAARPEIQAIRARARAKELQAQLTGRQRAPDLVFSAYRTPFFGTEPQQGVRLTLELPLLDYGSIASEEAAQREEAMAIEVSAKSQELTVFSQVQAAYRQARAAAERAVILRQSVEPNARRAAEMTQKAFMAGYADYLESITSQRTLRQARLQTARATADSLRALATLEQAVGSDPEELLRALQGGETTP